VGQALLDVSTQDFNFGTVLLKDNRLLEEFTLNNLSSKLPIRYTLNAPRSIWLSSAAGVLQPRGESVDLSNVAIKFRFLPLTAGLHTEYIDVFNQNNLSQQIRIRVRAFIDPELLQVTQVDGQPISPALALPNVHVGIQDGKLIWAGDISERLICVVLKNMSRTKSLSVYMNPASALELRRKDCLLLESTVSVAAGESALCNLILSDPPVVTKDEVDTLLDGRALEFKRDVDFMDASNGILGIISLRINFCVSIGSVGPATIDLGSFGADNATQTFALILTNNSDVESTWRCIDWPSFIKIDAQDDVVNVPPRQSMEVEVTFRSHACPVIGPQVFELAMQNVHSIEPPTIITISATINALVSVPPPLDIPSVRMVS
jgi:hypothetical protein